MRVELQEGIGFSAAHFIIGHKKCEYLHGHNWRIGLTVEGIEDERGLVVDFLDLKKLMEKICSSYDHRLLLPTKNPSLKATTSGESTRVDICGRKFEFPTSDIVWLPGVNTTVEEFARVIADEVARQLSDRPNVKTIKVLVEESPGQSATEERSVR